MRYVYPLLMLCAFALFIGSTLVATALLPFLVLGWVGLLLARRQFLAGVRLIPDALASCLRVARLLFGVVFSPLLGGKECPAELGYDHSDLPDLFALARPIAAELGVRSFDRVRLVAGVEVGVYETGGFLFWRTRRTLLLGLSVAYTLSVDELRTVLAHELAHFSRGHAVLQMTLDRFVEAMKALLEGIGYGLNPLYCSTLLSLKATRAIYLPWQRLQELDVDRDAALAVGANHAISALRRSREIFPAVVVAQIGILGTPGPVAPTHLGAASALLASRVPPRRQKALALHASGDVFARAHPEHQHDAERIAALHGLPSKPGLSEAPAITVLPEVRKLEQQVTRRLLRRARRFVEAEQYLQTLTSLEAAAAGSLVPVGSVSDPVPPPVAR